ncbi:subtilase family protein [Sediminihabitans luteus]|uniref:Subtilase family protein n=1 Tax=Sediminihabitans luteus TaxID=1138585 RepID=A0A2M9CEC5_9CELL|nr:S8 family serine peptidase [Sediminihabitans luteus]PJJ70281.1 subtilase family protein [Sediminihabitans luteus]GII97752.1 peptidase S8 [Sediminihabitans luteus]
MTRRRAAALSSLAVLALIATGAPAVAADGDPTDGAAIPLTDHDLPTDGKVAPALQDATGTVTAFVQLDTPSVVDAAGTDATPAEAAAVKDDVEALAAQVVPQSSSAKARSKAGTPTRLSVTSTLVSGVIVEGDAAKVRALADDASVTSVYRIIPKTPSNKGTDVFTKALATWQSTGKTGKGVRVAVVDTGLDYTHAEFGGPGTQAAYDAAYHGDGGGTPPAGTFDDAKFLGGYDFAGHDYDASGTVAGTTLVPSPDANPIDSPQALGSGHGSHVAGTTAGYGVLADGSTFRGDYSTLTDISDWKVGPGSAPEAGIYAYKVFGDMGGSTNVVIPALEAAADPNGDGDTSDHVDIVNMSLGSDFSPADDPENLFVDKLSEIGTLSVIASGNAGDVTDVGGSPGNSRSALTVASTLGNTRTLDAVEVTEGPLAGTYPAQNSINYAGTKDVTAPVAFLGATFDGCTAFTDAQKSAVAGKIAYLWWDDDDATRRCGSTARFDNATAAGAVGVLLPSSVPVFTAGISGNAKIPGAQLTRESTETLAAAIEAGTLTLAMGPSYLSASLVTDDSLADTVSDFSSRGVHGSLGVVKPDVAAPGSGISSAASGTGTDPSTKSGTSMATPHVAGIAALVLQAHPDWTPQQVKASVMNTATHDVWTEAGQQGVAYGPERVGAGRVDALDATENTTLAYAAADPDLVSVSFGVVPVGSKKVVLDKTVTVKNTGTKSATYTTGFTQSSTSGDASIKVTPRKIVVPAGGERTVTVTLTANPKSLAKEIDPTSDPESGVGVPRDFVSMVSGRVELTPTKGGDTLRVPVQAAPKLVSDMSAQDVTFAKGAENAPLTLEGKGVDSGGWLSIVAPFELKATSPVLPADAAAGASPSSIASGDIRNVGFASTAPQLAAAGANPAQGTIGIGIQVEGEWATLGSTMNPVVLTDVNGDGRPEFETDVYKYEDLDVTVADTYKITYAANGTPSYARVALEGVNGAFGDLDTTVFDNDTLVVPLPIAALGLKAGATPTFEVMTLSAYADGALDSVEFTADPFNPGYWFDGGSPDSLLFVDSPESELQVHRAKGATGDLLLLHMHNATGERGEVVEVEDSSTAITLGVSARSQCVNGKAMVAVYAYNSGTSKTTIDLTTPWGTETVKNVKPKSAAYKLFDTKSTSVTAGTATITGTAGSKGDQVSTQLTKPWAAISCS